MLKEFIGQSLQGRYRLDVLLGEGGMGACPGRKPPSVKRIANQSQITRWGYWHIDLNGRARIGDSARKVVSW